MKVVVLNALKYYLSLKFSPPEDSEFFLPGSCALFGKTLCSIMSLIKAQRLQAIVRGVLSRRFDSGLTYYQVTSEWFNKFATYVEDFNIANHPPAIDVGSLGMKADQVQYIPEGAWSLLVDEFGSNGKAIPA